MSTPEQFRAKAAELTLLADRAANSDVADALRLRERSFNGLADNSDKTVPAPAQRDPGDVVLAAGEDHILRCLGAALIMQWNELPRELQRNLFDHAGAMGEEFDIAMLRRRIARFLHQHKDEDAGRAIFAGDRRPTA